MGASASRRSSAASRSWPPRSPDRGSPAAAEHGRSAAEDQIDRAGDMALAPRATAEPGAERAGTGDVEQVHGEGDDEEGAAERERLRRCAPALRVEELRQEGEEE